jgi:hypothetical protein
MKRGQKDVSKRLVIDDLRNVFIKLISPKRGLAIRHKAFECLFFVQNRGPGVVEVKPRGVLARRLVSGRGLVDDARQEVSDCAHRGGELSSSNAILNSLLESEAFGSAPRVTMGYIVSA